MCSNLFKKYVLPYIVQYLFNTAQGKYNQKYTRFNSDGMFQIPQEIGVLLHEQIHFW